MKVYRRNNGTVPVRHSDPSAIPESGVFLTIRQTHRSLRETATRPSWNLRQITPMDKKSAQINTEVRTPRLSHAAPGSPA